MRGYMKSISHAFYKSKQWSVCRESYLATHSLCERCLKKGEIVPAEIVHHKIYLTDQNFQDPSIALNHANLEALCMKCHNQEHFGEKTESRWFFNSEGQFEMRS